MSCTGINILGFLACCSQPS
uniref:Uncharacterized protein n=1 Tax=Rhizophora mucronata TaxID=61149 RepID=A0A2P2QMX3_RHIMU